MHFTMRLLHNPRGSTIKETCCIRELSRKVYITSMIFIHLPSFVRVMQLLYLLVIYNIIRHDFMEKFNWESKHFD